MRRTIIILISVGVILDILNLLTSLPLPAIVFKIGHILIPIAFLLWLGKIYPGTYREGGSPFLVLLTVGVVLLTLLCNLLSFAFICWPVDEDADSTIPTSELLKENATTVAGIFLFLLLFELTLYGIVKLIFQLSKKYQTFKYPEQLALISTTFVFLYGILFLIRCFYNILHRYEWQTGSYILPLP